MLRRAAALVVLIAMAPVATLAADAPRARPRTSPTPANALYRKVPATFSNPGGSRNQPAMNGQGCIASQTNANQTAINPITGKKQAAPIVSIPLGAGSGSVASSTNRASQAHNCANARN